MMFRKAYIKRIAAAMTASAMLLSLTACGEDTTWAAVIDGTQIKAGLFIYYLQTGYYQAQSQLTANEDGTMPDIYTAQIDGKDGKTWIYDYATEQMQKYAAIEAKAAEYGIEITEDEKEAAKISTESTWDYIQQFYGDDYFSSVGISFESYLDAYLNDMKYNKLFDKLYSEGGDYAVSQDEIRTYMDENYALINYIEMELKDGEGNLLKSEDKAERVAMAEDYIARYNAGEDFDMLNAEYTNYYNDLIAAAEAAAAEAASDTETTETAEVEALPAEAEEAESENGEVTAAETEAPAEDTEESDSEAAETSAEDAEAADADAAVSEETTAEAAEETAAETTAETAAETAEDTSSSETVPGELVSSVPSNETVIEKAGTTPNATVVTEVFNNMQKGEIKLVEDPAGEYMYLVLKLDILEDDEYVDMAQASILYEMKGDTFEELIKEWVTAQVFEKNEKAYARYDAKKLFGSNE
ncbi:MAG: hypothetical protein ACI4KF_01930 [Huintestinicola sp.]